MVAGLAGEIGVRGATGDLSDREGLVGWAVEMLRDNLGLAAERIILTRTEKTIEQSKLMKMRM